jgi:hypothetical protein
MPHGQHATHFDGEIEVMNTALIQLFVRTESIHRAVIFTDSISAIQSIAKFYAFQLKGLQKSIKLWKGIHRM